MMYPSRYYGGVKYGDRGEDVKKLQEDLNASGYQVAVDGDYGPETQAAVNDYNKKASTGKAKPATASVKASSTPSGQVSVIAGTPSSTVQQAQQLLSQYRPNGFTSNYSEPLDQVVMDIINRKPFEYNMENDPLYQNYRDFYQRQGKLAMEDTIGKATALTGGYANSYAMNVGQQAYNAYLDQLNGMLPELRQQALDEYNAETNALYDQFNLLYGLEGQDYDRWATERSLQQKSSGSGRSSNSEESYDNGNLSSSTIKNMQYSLGVEATGNWDSATQAAANGLSADEAWTAYKNGDTSIFKPVGVMADWYEKYSSSGSTEAATPAIADSAAAKSFRGNVMNSQDFARHNRKVTMGGKVYTFDSYNDYLEAALDRDLAAGRISESDLRFLINYYGL